MKIICIKKYVSQGLQLELTYGKVYNILPWAISQIELGYDKRYYKIVNDRGVAIWYDKSDFVSQEEWRDMKIKELGLYN